jgi:uncharacterized protein (TIGR02996 family)
MRDENVLLAALAEQPADELTWLAYADWLEEQGGERHRFVRLLIELARGVEGEASQADFRKRFKRLRGIDPDWRERVVQMRAGLPLRFRVTSASLMRCRPEEMFDRSMTLLEGFVEQGTVRAGQPLTAHRRDAAAVETAGVMLVRFAQDFQVHSAGREPILIGLAWRGRHEGLCQRPFLVTDC